VLLKPLDPLELDELDELLDPLELDEFVEFDELDEFVLLLDVVAADEMVWSVRFQTMPKSAIEATARVQRALRRVAARLAAPIAAALPPALPARAPAADLARVACVGAGVATPSSAMVTSPMGCATQLST
jgi:hypothetical protein